MCSSNWDAAIRSHGRTIKYSIDDLRKQYSYKQYSDKQMHWPNDHHNGYYTLDHATSSTHVHIRNTWLHSSIEKQAPVNCIGVRNWLRDVGQQRRGSSQGHGPAQQRLIVGLIPPDVGRRRGSARRQSVLDPQLRDVAQHQPQVGFVAVHPE